MLNTDKFHSDGEGFPQAIHTAQASEKPRARPKAKPKHAKKRVGARKVKQAEHSTALADGTLTSTSATSYRALRARGNYLALDRVDVSCSTKELCRDFSVPNTLSFNKLKRLARHCIGHQRLACHYAFQTMPAHIETVVDTDVAGCTIT